METHEDFAESKWLSEHLRLYTRLTAARAALHRTLIAMLQDRIYRIDPRLNAVFWTSRHEANFEIKLDGGMVKFSLPLANFEFFERHITETSTELSRRFGVALVPVNDAHREPRAPQSDVPFVLTRAQLGALIDWTNQFIELVDEPTGRLGSRQDSIEHMPSDEVISIAESIFDAADSYAIEKHLPARDG